MSAILVIDDDPAAVQILKLALGRNGHAVDVATDVTSGRSAVRSRPYDLMILGEAFYFGQEIADAERLGHVSRGAGSFGPGQEPGLVVAGQEQDRQRRAELAAQIPEEVQAATVGQEHVIETLLLSRYPRTRDRLVLVGAALLECFGYRQILAFERFIAMFQIRRKRGKWGSMVRGGLGGRETPAA